MKRHARNSDPTAPFVGYVREGRRPCCYGRQTAKTSHRPSADTGKAAFTTPFSDTRTGIQTILHPVFEVHQPQLLRNRLDRRPLRLILLLQFLSQAHRPFPDLRGISSCCVHCSTLSKNGASGKAGAIHSSRRSPPLANRVSIRIPIRLADRVAWSVLLHITADSPLLALPPREGTG